MTTILRRSAQEKVRDQILRVVRQMLPKEDVTQISELTLNRSVCPQLEPRTWSMVNGALPTGWAVTDLRDTTFVLSVAGRTS